jgi:hypothetical protein
MPPIVRWAGLSLSLYYARFIKPPPFGLIFKPGPDSITVRSFDVAEASTIAVASVTLVQRINLALDRRSPRTVEALAEELEAKPATIRKTLERYRGKGFVSLPDTDPQQWAKESTRT